MGLPAIAIAVAAVSIPAVLTAGPAGPAVPYEAPSLLAHGPAAISPLTPGHQPATLWLAPPVPKPAAPKLLPRRLPSHPQHVAVVRHHAHVRHHVRIVVRAAPHKAHVIYTARTIIGSPNSVPAWVGAAMKLTGVHGADWASGLKIITKGESNNNRLVAPGQPGYYCDSNCTSGISSQGIAQLIPATMATYHQPGTSHNRLNPIACLAAGIRYIKSRYGTIDNVPGVASVRSGGSYMGY